MYKNISTFLSKILLLSLACFIITACVRMPKVSPPEEEKPEEKPEEKAEINTCYEYIYPYGNEIVSPFTEIIIKLKSPVTAQELEATIPHLKYNKEWLFLLTQDDCRHDAYSSTWAAINGKPLSEQYYYSAAQLHNNDLPPNCYSLDKTLGYTDGAGKEVRFAFTTTLYPESEKMNENIVINPGFKEDYHRFYQKSYLIWDNVKELLAFGNSIAFHNVKIADQKIVADISQHYIIAQDSILKHSNGRKCKVLAEPDGNKAYIDAAQTDPIIKIMINQSSADILYPYKVTGTLNKSVLNRVFYTPDIAKQEIAQQLAKPKEERKAIAVGIHESSRSWNDFLLWLNNTHGKDGDNSVWFPSLEEYYEYNYYRINCTPTIELVDNNTIKLKVAFPSTQNFYYPSITVNIKGITKENIATITSNNAVTGLSYGNYTNNSVTGTMINIDCRKLLVEHATHFVERYEKDKSNLSNKADAVYFVNMLKDSNNKSTLQGRLK